MANNMKANADITRLRRLQAEIDRIRAKLAISAPGEVLYRASLDVCGDDEIVVEADGFGGAATSVVEGNFPMDYQTHYAKKFRTEEAALHAAEAIEEERAEAEVILV
jgi:hypothetical protein